MSNVWIVRLPLWSEHKLYIIIPTAYEFGAVILNCAVESSWRGRSCSEFQKWGTALAPMVWSPKWGAVRREAQTPSCALHRKGFEHEKQNLHLDPLGNGSPVNLNDPWTFVDDCWCTIMYHMKLIKEFWGARPERMALQYFQRRRVQGMNQNVWWEQIKVPRKSPEMLLTWN